MSTLPTWEDLAVGWGEDDDGQDLITVADTRTHPATILVELPPLEALAMAGQIVGLARDALTAHLGALLDQPAVAFDPEDLNAPKASGGV